MKKNILILILSLVLAASLSAQTIVPTQTDEIIIDNGTMGKAEPGDTIRYKVTITNSGADGTGVQLNVTPDILTTMVPGSFKSSPLAIDDAYQCTGNVGISVPAISGLLDNDFDDELIGLSATAETVASINGGSATIAADGSFTYTPPAGFNGMDEFIYTLIDGNDVDGMGPIPGTAVGTVTITVNNLIWFVDNSAGAGDGRLNSPFNTLTSFNAGSTAAGDVIYIEETGSGAYTGGIVLQDNEKLFGKGHTGAGNLAGVLSFTLAPNSFALPTISGSRPVVTNASGDGVTLAMDNNLRGFNVGACSDFGIENSGTASVGNLMLSEVTINNTTGGGFDASHGSGASMNAVFTSISSSSGTNGINLTSCAGTFTVNGGTISNPTGTGVLISGGSVVFSSSGAISDNTGFAVDVDNHDSGNVTFSGNITSTGTGIRVQNCGGGTKTFSGGSKSLTTGTNTAVTLTSNSGATINFSNGGLAITTTHSTGFNATGGGTVNVAGAGNTISSTTGTALNVANTTIGATDLNFKSVSVNGATTGITLNNTGTMGGLKIGAGGATIPNGGTIQNVTTAFSLTNTSNLLLQFMSIKDVVGDAVFGTGLTDGSAGAEKTFEVQNCQFLDIGTNAGTDEVFDFKSIDMPGTANITGSILINGSIFDEDAANADNSFAGNGLFVINNIGTLNVTVTNSTFKNTPNTADQAINLSSRTAATINAVVTDCVAEQVRGELFSLIVEGSSALGDVDFKRNRVVGNTTTSFGSGVRVAVNKGGRATFDITDNDAAGCATCGFFDCFGDPIEVSLNDDGTNLNGRLEGRINRNLVSSSFSHSIKILMDGNSLVSGAGASGAFSANIEVNNNTVVKTKFDSGVNIQIRDANSVVVPAERTVDLTFLNNQFGVGAGNALSDNALFANIFATNAIVNFLLDGNTFILDGVGLDEAIRIRSRDDANVSATIINGNYNQPGSQEEVRFATETAGNPTGCLDIRNNMLEGGLGEIQIDEVFGTMNITQLSQSNIATLNGIPTANVLISGTPTFNAGACSQPAPPTNL